MRVALCLLATTVAMTGCGGRVGSLHVKALARYGDRDVTVASPEVRDPLDAEVRDAVVAGLARGGVSATENPRPGAFVLRPRLVRPEEEIAGGGALRSWGHTIDERAEKAVRVFQRGSYAYNQTRAHLELLMWAPGREKPIGAAYWDGFWEEDPAATVRRAAEETGEAMAREIGLQRERWFTRRVADERLFLTATPNLIPEGEWVLSNDEALVFHLGHGYRDWIQGDLTLGALPVPVAAAGAIAGGGGVGAGGIAGFGAVGVLNVGVKVRVLEEGRARPGLSAAYDMVNVWGGAFGAGGVVALGKGVAAGAATGAAGFNLQFNLLTVSASKHLWDWLQVGTGLYVLDNHALIPQSKGFAYADTFGNSTTSSSRITDRVPTLAVPWLSLEAAAGMRVRFVSEYLFSPGSDWVSLGMRTLIHRTRFGFVRTGHLAAKIDTAVLFTRYTEHDTQQRRIVPLPWLGVAFYVR